MKAVEAIGPTLAVLEATGWNDSLHDAVIWVCPGLARRSWSRPSPAYARAHDEDFRHGVIAVLAELGVRDDRVLALLLGQLRADPSRGASNLATYGDPKALEHLVRAFDAFELEGRTSPLANHALVELRDAIEHLGGALTRAQEAKYTKGMAAGDEVAAEVSDARRRVEPTPVEKLGRNDRCWCGSGMKSPRSAIRGQEARDPGPTRQPNRSGREILCGCRARGMRLGSWKGLHGIP